MAVLVAIFLFICVYVSEMFAKVQKNENMKVFELINFNRELLKKLQKAGIRLDDAQYIDLYSDYVDMYQQGEKVSYIVAALSEKYAVSERKVYGLLKRFQSDCKPFAV